MSHCKPYEAELRECLATGRPPSKEFEQHYRNCRLCATMLHLPTSIEMLAEKQDRKDGMKFDAMRGRVLAEIKQGEFQPKPVKRPIWMWAVVPLSMAAGLLLGFLVFRQVGPDALTIPNDAQFMQMISQEASDNRDIGDSLNSPVAYTNVSLNTLPDGMVHVSFDVTNHVEYVASVEDPVVRELLVQSLISPAPLQNRLEAIGMAEQMMEPKVKEAVILAMTSDPDLAVRFKALSLLGPHSEDGEVQVAMMTVLQEDESVNMRLSALEYLGGMDLPPTQIEALREEFEARDDRALLWKISEPDMR